MKRIPFCILVLLISTAAFSQSRSSGQALVPIGDENDSLIRLAMYSTSASNFLLHGQSYLDSVLADINCTWDEEFGQQYVTSGDAPQPVQRVGLSAYGIHMRVGPSLRDLATNLRVRTWSATAVPLSSWSHRGLYWKYNAVNVPGTGAHWYNTEYDANDISPYSEYPANDTFVKETFHTKQFNNVDSVVPYGEVGRVILARNDIEDANLNLLRSNSSVFGVARDANGDFLLKDSAKLFTATFEFNLNESSIDTALRSGRATQDLPLVRLQILYKDGVNAVNLAGRSVSPFVPFKTAAHPLNKGWLALVDTIITKRIYDSLWNSWRAPDTLANGLEAPGGRFKQLHVQLRGAPLSMDTLNKAIYGNWGQLGDDDGSSPMTDTLHPDSSGFVIADTTKSKNIIEMRVLSTYRATVRVRSLVFGDTISDKYLYRKPDTIPGKSYSCNPDGTHGGYDDSVKALMSRSSDSIGHKPMEILLIDDDPGNNYPEPALGYLEYMGRPYNIHTHLHQQDNGHEARTFRRECVSYGGVPPSMFENEIQQFTAPLPMLPRDYIYYAHSYDTNKTWPDTTDKLVGVYITRPVHDSALLTYNQYTDYYSNRANRYWFGEHHATAIVAMHHPNNRKFAVEINIPSWGALYTGTYWDTSIGHWHYDASNATFNMRNTTPEELMAGVFMDFATGITSFNDAQAFEPSPVDHSLLGFWTINKHPASGPGSDSVYWVHDYNVGHRYGLWSYYNIGMKMKPPNSDYDSAMPVWTKTNDMDGNFPNYYLGYSNTFRAIKRVMGRLHAIFDTSATNQYPVRRLQWIDAYDMAGDTATSNYQIKAASFLKVVKTLPVNPWQRNTDSSYKDLTTPDDSSKTYAVVGTFKRNDNSAYGALVVNTRTFPGRDTADLNYFNAGMDSISRRHPTLGDIDVRKVYMHIDSSQFPKPFQAQYYAVRDLWKPDSTWYVNKDSDFYVYLKPGDAKFLYIELPSAATLASLSTNVWNNARHLAYDESGHDPSHVYWSVYERKGKIYATSPLEITEGDSRRRADVLPEVVIDSSGKAHNPAIAIQPDSGCFGVVYSIDHHGIALDTTYVISRFSHSTAGRSYITKDTLDSFTYSATDTTFVAAPAISPLCHTNSPTHHWSQPYQFWVSWRNPVHGGAITLVDSAGHSHIRYFSAGDSADTKFVSLASRVKYTQSPIWVGFRRCYIAFEEQSTIYYLEAWPDTLTSDSIKIGRLTNVSGAGACHDRTPCANVDEGGNVTIAWERLHTFYDEGPDLSHSVVYRHKDPGFPPTWSDFTSFWGSTTFFSDHDTIFLRPSLTATDGVWALPWRTTPWADWVRIAWSNPYNGMTTIAHYGDGWKWYRHHLLDSAVEPAFAVWEKSFVPYESLPEGMMYRSPHRNSDTTFAGKITRYDFPITPVKAESQLMMQTFTASAHPQCVTIGMFAGWQSKGNGATPASAIFPHGSDTARSIISWLPIDPRPFDTTVSHPTVSWSSPSVRTCTFFAFSGDSLSYTRMFRAGDYNAGDTAALQGDLTPFTGDYLRGSINLRRSSDNSIIQVLDTARLKPSGFFTSTSLSDSGFGKASIVFTDSFYLSMDIARGDSTDSFELNHIESYGDRTSEVIPGSMDTSGNPGSDNPGFKRTSTPPPTLGTAEPLAVSIHPNPASSYVLICVASIPADDPFFAEVVSSTGAQITKIYEATPENDLGLCFRMDCSQLAAGTYYVRVANSSLGRVVKFQVVR